MSHFHLVAIKELLLTTSVLMSQLYQQFALLHRNRKHMRTIIVSSEHGGRGWAGTPHGWIELHLGIALGLTYSHIDIFIYRFTYKDFGLLLSASLPRFPSIDYKCVVTYVWNFFAVLVVVSESAEKSKHSSWSSIQRQPTFHYIKKTVGP